MWKKLCLILLSLWACQVLGQADSAKAQPDSIAISSNPDSAFAQARQFAYEEDFQKAEKILSLLTTKYPDNFDYWLFRARNNSWAKRYFQARRQVSRVLVLDSSRIDAYKVLANIERYDKKYDTAIGVCKYGLRKLPKDEFFLVTKAQCQTAKMDYHDALQSVNQGLAAHPDNEELSKLKIFLLNQLFQEGLAIGAGVSYFTSDFDPWFSGMVQYGHFTNVGPLIGRVNIANRFYDQYGAQVEADFYPQISRGQYFYLNLGYSQSDIFPNWRLGAEYYTLIPGAENFELSGGFRYLVFGRNNSVFITTGSLGWYFGDNYLQFRPFFINEEGGIGSSYNVTYRHIMGGMGDFYQFTAGAGAIPNQEIIQVGGVIGRQITNLQNGYLGFAIQNIISEDLYMRADLNLTRQEKFSDFDEFYNIISIFLTIGYRI